MKHKKLLIPIAVSLILATTGLKHFSHLKRTYRQKTENLRAINSNQKLVDYKELKSRIKFLEDEIEKGVSLRLLVDPNYSEQRERILTESRETYTRYCEAKNQLERLSEDPNTTALLKEREEIAEDYYNFTKNSELSALLCGALLGGAIAFPPLCLLRYATDHNRNI